MGETEFQTEFEFPLTKPFTYSAKGEQVTATSITLSAPTSRNSDECAALKQAFMRAIPKEAKRESDTTITKDDDKIDADDVIQIMAMSIDVDLPQVFKVAKKLFTSGTIAMVDGEQKLTNNLVEKMDQNDFELMLGEYLVNFTLASTLEKMNKKS